MQAVLNLVWDILLPAMSVEPLQADQRAANRLKRTLQTLQLPPTPGAADSPLAAEVSGKTYTFEPNYETLHSLSFDFGKESFTLSYRLLGGGVRRGLHHLMGRYGAWQETETVLGTGGPRGIAPAEPQPIAASGAWTAADTFTLTLCMYETPFIATISCRFAREQVFYNFKFNVSFGPTQMPELVGKLGSPTSST
jgi:hypothetical protein